MDENNKEKKRRKKKNNDSPPPRASPPPSLRPFTIPKTGNKELFVSLDLESHEAKDIVKNVNNSLWDRASTAINVIKIEKVQNSLFQSEYDTKRKEFKEKKYTTSETADSYGFLYFKNIAECKKACSDGIIRGEQRLPSTAGYSIGDKKYGIYLCRCADILNTVPLWEKNSIIVLVCKFMKGKTNTVNENTHSTVEPTPEFDAHTSKSFQRGKKWTHAKIYNTSQIYIYEVDLDKFSEEDEDAIYAKRPRQCLPYAIATFHVQQTLQPTVITKGPVAQKNTSKQIASTIQTPAPTTNNPTPPAADFEAMVFNNRMVWSGEYYNNTTSFGKVRLCMYSKEMNTLALPIDGAALCVTQKILLSKLEKVLPNKIFRKCPCLSMRYAETVGNDRFLHAEMYPESICSNKFEHFHQHLLKSKMAGMSTIRPGLKMFVLPTGDYTHKIGITSPGYPPILHCLFLKPFKEGDVIIDNRDKLYEGFKARIYDCLLQRLQQNEQLKSQNSKNPSPITKLKYGYSIPQRTKILASYSALRKVCAANARKSCLPSSSTATTATASKQAKPDDRAMFPDQRPSAQIPPADNVRPISPPPSLPSIPSVGVPISTPSTVANSAQVNNSAPSMSSMSALMNSPAFQLLRQSNPSAVKEIIGNNPDILESQSATPKEAAVKNKTVESASGSAVISERPSVTTVPTISNAVTTSSSTLSGFRIPRRSSSSSTSNVIELNKSQQPSSQPQQPANTTQTKNATPDTTPAPAPYVPNARSTQQTLYCKSALGVMSLLSNISEETRQKEKEQMERDAAMARGEKATVHGSPYKSSRDRSGDRSRDRDRDRDRRRGHRDRSRDRTRDRRRSRSRSRDRRRSRSRDRDRSRGRHSRHRDRSDSKSRSSRKTTIISEESTQKKDFGSIWQQKMKEAEDKFADIYSTYKKNSSQEESQTEGSLVIDTAIESDMTISPLKQPASHQRQNNTNSTINTSNELPSLQNERVVEPLEAPPPQQSAPQQNTNDVRQQDTIAQLIDRKFYPEDQLSPHQQNNSMNVFSEMRRNALSTAEEHRGLDNSFRFEDVSSESELSKMGEAILSTRRTSTHSRQHDFFQSDDETFLQSPQLHLKSPQPQPPSDERPKDLGSATQETSTTTSSITTTPNNNTTNQSTTTAAPTLTTTDSNGLKNTNSSLTSYRNSPSPTPSSNSSSKSRREAKRRREERSQLDPSSSEDERSDKRSSSSSSKKRKTDKSRKSDERDQSKKKYTSDEKTKTTETDKKPVVSGKEPEKKTPKPNEKAAVNPETTNKIGMTEFLAQLSSFRKDEDDPKPQALQDNERAKHKLKELLHCIEEPPTETITDHRTCKIKQATLPKQKRRTSKSQTIGNFPDQKHKLTPSNQSRNVLVEKKVLNTTTSTPNTPKLPTVKSVANKADKRGETPPLNPNEDDLDSIDMEISKSPSPTKIAYHVSNGATSLFPQVVPLPENQAPISDNVASIDRGLSTVRAVSGNRVNRDITSTIGLIADRSTPKSLKEWKERLKDQNKEIDDFCMNLIQEMTNVLE